MELIGYTALVAVGVLLGVMGGGGSILSVPILVYLFSLDVVMASSYSLFIVGTTSLIGTALKHQDRNTHVPAALQLGIPSVVVTFWTRTWIVGRIPDVLSITDSLTASKRTLLLSLFALALIVASLMMIRKQMYPADQASESSPWRVACAGMIIGLLSGLAGVGGGFLILPALVLFAGLKFPIAVGSALPIIAMNSLVGFLGDAISHPINWMFLISITLLATAGIFIGNVVAGKISSNELRKSFGWSTLGMGLWILFKEW